MSRGPLPDPAARRRNQPTIPTTALPVDGRQGPAPACPYELAEAGRAWWVWAWGTPQAAAWDAGVLYVVARRARLEDDAAALSFGDCPLDLADLFAEGDVEARRRVEWALDSLRRSASGKLALEKEMRELDGRLGLTPEAMAKLRWRVVDDAPVSTAKRAAAATRRTALRAVDPDLTQTG